MEATTAESSRASSLGCSPAVTRGRGKGNFATLCCSTRRVLQCIAPPQSTALCVIVQGTISVRLVALRVKQKVEVQCDNFLRDGAYCESVNEDRSVVRDHDGEGRFTSRPRVMRLKPHRGRSASRPTYNCRSQIKIAWARCSKSEFSQGWSYDSPVTKTLPVSTVPADLYRSDSGLILMRGRHLVLCATLGTSHFPLTLPLRER